MRSYRTILSSNTQEKAMDNPFEIIDRRLSNLEALLMELLTHLRDNASASVPEIGGIALAQQVTYLSKARLYALVSARQIPHAKRGNMGWSSKNGQ